MHQSNKQMIVLILHFQTFPLLCSAAPIRVIRSVSGFALFLLLQLIQIQLFDRIGYCCLTSPEAGPGSGLPLPEVIQMRSALFVAGVIAPRLVLFK